MAAIQLVVFDMEGTLTTDPTVWEIMHLKNGTWKSHGLPYWESFRAGGLHYDKFARKDVAAWKGAPVSMLEDAVTEVPLTAGCEALLAGLRDRGIRSAIVSNGLERLGLRLAKELGIHRVAANREVVADDVLTGELEIGVPFDEKGKALLDLLGEMAVHPAEVMVVGDGIADVQMFQHAGRSVAFMAESAEVAAAADYIISEPDLRRVLEVLL